ncbi:MAG TPA: hypothetical protein VFR81_21650 [Longimicrobium sp.]|nr:hypothetical protein [Longimicrobium sp.]
MTATATAAPRLPLPTESELRRIAGETIFARGAAYCRQGAVLSLARRAGHVVAEVAGSEAQPYRVTLSGVDGRLRATCDCPFAVEAETWCKHQVAAVLHALRDPAAIGDEPALEALLAPLSAEQLRSLVAQWAGEDPDGYDRVRAFAARCNAPDGTPESVDAVRGAVSRRMRRIVHSLETIDDSRAYWQVGELAAQVEHIVEEAREALAAGECAVAIATLDAVTREYVDGWGGVDDGDGSLGAVFHALSHAWAEAALVAPLTADGRRALAEQLREWSDEVEDYGIEELGLAVAAMEEGWDAPHVARALSGDPSAARDADPDPTEEADGDGNGWDMELAEVRLGVLERAGRLDDALLLARASGLHGRAADLLLTLGRVDEALATALEHRTSRSESLALARRLWEGGDHDRALTLGEAALESAGDADAALAAWVRDRAEEAGRADLALRAAEPAFRASPRLESWAALARLAGDGWPALRERMLAWLIESGAGRYLGGIDVLLAEERFAEALDVVEESGSWSLADRVAEAALDHLPERVIPLCRKHAERIMNAGQASAYEAAADWLRRARRACAATGRAGEWNSYLGRILVQHKAKYRLRPLLEKLGYLD